MKIITLDMKNVLGVKEFKLDAGQITTIKGRNAQGKTSILTAIQNAIGGGNLSNIKNLDAEDDARIVLALRDNDGINYVLDKNENGLKIKQQVGDTAGFKAVPKPQQFLNMLRDCKLPNPIDFLNAKDKERVQLILEAIDLPFDSGKMWEAIGVERGKLGAIPEGMHPLNEIAFVRNLIFDERTGINRTEKAKRSTCEENRLSVPAEIPTVNGLAEKENELSGYKTKRAELTEQAGHEKQKLISAAQSKYQHEKIQLENSLEQLILHEDAALEAKIAEMRRQSKELKDRYHEEHRNALDMHGQKLEKRKQEAEQKHIEDLKSISELSPEIERLTSELSEMREQEKNIVRIKTIHDQADKMEKEANDLAAYSEQLTNGLKNLDNYKASLSENLPVEGLDLTDNKVSINGVKWEHLNTAQKIIVAVKIIAERSKGFDFKFCLVDGVEALDSENQKVLEQTLLSHDIQAVLGRVVDCDLEVEK